MTFSRVVRVPRTGSTNADLRAAALADPDAWPHGSALVAGHQEAGRGRAGRTWVTPPGTALTASILVRPGVPADRLGWLPLLAGLAVQRAAAAQLDGTTIGVKWPNDVVAIGAGADDVDGWGRDRKLAGILVEALPSDSGSSPVAAVVGIGLNVAQATGDLPVPWATSLRLLGARTTPEEMLTAVGNELLPVLARWTDAAGDAEAAGLRAQVTGVCSTVGAHVRTELPTGPGPSGLAVGLDQDGRLLVDTGHDVVAVTAGDVLHLRTGGGDQRGPSAP